MSSIFDFASPLPPASSFPLHWWQGLSGERRWFSVFSLDQYFDFDGIVYILARARGDGLYDPLYVGQSEQGGVRLSSHEKMEPAKRRGATHVHVHFVENRAERFRIETDLRRQFNPPLNEQSTPALSLGDLAPGRGFGFSLLPRANSAPSGLSLANALLAIGTPPKQPTNSLADFANPLMPDNALNYLTGLAALNPLTPRRR